MTELKRLNDEEIKTYLAQLEAADKTGVAVFLKNNLFELVNYESPETNFAFNKEGFYRQEFPGE